MSNLKTKQSERNEWQDAMCEDGSPEEVCELFTANTIHDLIEDVNTMHTLLTSLLATLTEPGRVAGVTQERMIEEIRETLGVETEAGK